MARSDGHGKRADVKNGARQSARPAAILRAAWVFLAACPVWFAIACPAIAQEPPPRLVERVPEAGLVPLPDARETPHTIVLPDRTLHFKATAGALAIGNAERAILADVSYVAYTMAGSERAPRPVIFAFNGGPGSASAWLHLGALGPWHVPLTSETVANPATPALAGNPDTWLDFADLVFIDPPGTGFSAVWQATKGAAAVTGIYSDPVLPAMRRERRGQPSASSRLPGSRNTGGPEWFWSVEGDVVTFAEFIAAWVERHGRRNAPVVIVGESYGGFRTPLIAEHLSAQHALRVSAMVLVSPVLDFDGRRGWRTPQHYVALLPSIAATAMERAGAEPSRLSLADAETYASGEYLLDLMRGPRDKAALGRMSDRVAALSRVPVEAVSRLGARLTIRSFIEHSPQLSNHVVSLYDAGMTGLKAPPGRSRGGFGDAFTGGLNPPLSAAMDVLHERLSWQPARPYVMLSGDVNRRWRWPNAPHAPEALSALSELHREQPLLRTLIVHGFTDLVTPYWASATQLAQLPAHGPENRIAFQVYAGGHMFYSRNGSRARFRSDSQGMLGEVFGSGIKKPNSEQGETP
jgi:carboxypeptidase C (cathepsin A)